MILYPRSFLRLILLAWALVVLPLLLAIGYVSISLNTVTEHSEATVREASMTARLSWELPEQLNLMERSLRQYEVLHDAALIDEYTAASLEWHQRCDELLRIPLLASFAPKVKQMQAREAAARARFIAAPAGAKVMREVVGDLKTSTFALLNEAGHHVDTATETFRRDVEAMRDRLLLALALALSLAVAMFWFGRRIVARLLSRVERAVIALGRNRLDRSIRLKGPEDVQAIGRRLDWLRRRLLALEQQRTRILRHVSHELKTPLAALREGSSLLNEGLAGELTPQQARIASIMQGNSLRLQALIDGLLRMQQAGHMRDRFEPVALRLDEMLHQVLATHQLAARSKRLHISGSMAPLTVDGGTEEMTTILDNLISNAIKFSPENGLIRVTLAREGDNVILDVIDQGPGVPEPERDKIFEPFYRSTASKGIAGVGLGLAIAREFVAAHRGSLELVESTAGAHFRTTFPIAGKTP